MLQIVYGRFDVFVLGERRREAWSGDRRRRFKVGGEESGGRRRDEAEEGLRDVIYVQASCKTTAGSFSDAPHIPKVWTKEVLN